MSLVNRSVPDTHLAPTGSKRDSAEQLREKLASGRKKAGEISASTRRLKSFLAGRVRQWEEKMEALR